MKNIKNLLKSLSCHSAFGAFINISRILKNTSKKVYTRLCAICAARQICGLQSYRLTMAGQSQARVQEGVQEKHLGDVTSCQHIDHLQKLVPVWE